MKKFQGKTLAEKRALLMKEIQEKKRVQKRTQSGNNEMNADGEEWEDVDEHEKEVFATTGYFDVPDSEAHISAADQKLL
jgi:hypothetical protein